MAIYKRRRVDIGRAQAAQPVSIAPAIQPVQQAAGAVYNSIHQQAKDIMAREHAENKARVAAEQGEQGALFGLEGGDVNDLPTNTFADRAYRASALKGVEQKVQNDERSMLSGYLPRLQAEDPAERANALEDLKADGEAYLQTISNPLIRAQSEYRLQGVYNQYIKENARYARTYKTKATPLTVAEKIALNKEVNALLQSGKQINIDAFLSGRGESEQAYAYPLLIATNQITAGDVLERVQGAFLADLPNQTPESLEAAVEKITELSNTIGGDAKVTQSLVADRDRLIAEMRNKFAAQVNADNNEQAQKTINRFAFDAGTGITPANGFKRYTDVMNAAGNPAIDDKQQKALLDGAEKIRAAYSTAIDETSTELARELVVLKDGVYDFSKLDSYFATHIAQMKAMGIWDTKREKALADKLATGAAQKLAIIAVRRARELNAIANKDGLVGTHKADDIFMQAIEPIANRFNVSVTELESVGKAWIKRQDDLTDDALNAAQRDNEKEQAENLQKALGWVDGLAAENKSKVAGDNFLASNAGDAEDKNAATVFLADPNMREELNKKGNEKRKAILIGMAIGHNTQGHANEMLRYLVEANNNKEEAVARYLRAYPGEVKNTKEFALFVQYGMDEAEKVYKRDDMGAKQFISDGSVKKDLRDVAGEINQQNIVESSAVDVIKAARGDITRELESRVKSGVYTNGEYFTRAEYKALDRKFKALVAGGAVDEDNADYRRALHELRKANPQKAAADVMLDKLNIPLAKAPQPEESAVYNKAARDTYPQMKNNPIAISRIGAALFYATFNPQATTQESSSWIFWSDKDNAAGKEARTRVHNDYAYEQTSEAIMPPIVRDGAFVEMRNEDDFVEVLETSTIYIGSENQGVTGYAPLDSDLRDELIDGVVDGDYELIAAGEDADDGLGMMVRVVETGEALTRANGEKVYVYPEVVETREDVGDKKVDPNRKTRGTIDAITRLFD